MLTIDGALYPLHLAIGTRWKLHYLSAEMADEPKRREEEAGFLADPRAALGGEAIVRLEAIRDALALDFGGIDFGFTRDGTLVVFEANATMVMVPLAADAKWDYRRMAFDNVFAAVRTMLLHRAHERA